MKELTCIVCPNGCSLRVEKTENGWEVRGNQCRRGEHFAIEEMTHPMRTISTTVRTIYPEVLVLPVRVSAEIPREKIFPVMQEINRVTVEHICGTLDPVIENVLGLGADVIVTSNILKETIRTETKAAEDETKKVCKKGAKSDEQ